MLGRGVVIGYPITGSKLSEHWHIELSTVVADQRSGNAESADNVFYHEILHLFLSYGFQGLCLIPFSEVVHCNDGEFDLTLCHRELPDQVDAPIERTAKG